MLMDGYVTTHASIIGKSARELEQVLGFRAGSLSTGYSVYALSVPVAIGEFEWKDRTSYSDGWHYDPSIQEHVQRRDELRAHLGKVNSWNESATDLQLRLFMQQQRSALNIRVGPNRIVKLLPKVRPAAFPDSPFRGIPQWKLTVQKVFTLLT